MELEQIKLYLSSLSKSCFDIDILCHLGELKKKAIASNQESIANEIWCLETIGDIQRLFISAFNSIKTGKYFDAWRSYERIDIELSFLRKHIDYCDNKYNLGFIEEYTRKYQKFFPYVHFMSRESIIKKESCSICGRVNTIRNRCEHEVGELYMGEMCNRIVEDIEIISIAIVVNPLDKYAVLTPVDKEYNYEAIDTLFMGLNTPYDRWNLDIEKTRNPDFLKAKTSKPCPCGSGKKYKNCCLNTDVETINHHKITYLDNPHAKSVPYKTIGTWKIRPD